VDQGAAGGPVSYEGNGTGANGNNCTKFTIPILATKAGSGTVGSPITDQATLSGSSGAGTITWNVHASSDTKCATSLNASAITRSVSGDGTYTSPGFTATATGTYQWVAS
jgi:hypothetical protein